jgi:hypothetical protein
MTQVSSLHTYLSWRLPIYTIHFLSSVEDTEATNEFINDKEDVQLMTYEEIEALKEAGAHMQVN